MRSYSAGPGVVEVDDCGLVVAARHPVHGGCNALLDDTVAWHELARWWGANLRIDESSRWGSGFLISSVGSGRFVQPREVSFAADSVVAECVPVPGLALSVTRTFGTGWRERYVLRNETQSTVSIGSYAIAIPIRDVYGPARRVLREHFQAHVWTGGAESWLAAVRMDGTPPALTLDLTEGELWSYSIVGRGGRSRANFRGIIYLHATDYHRAPHAFGGQPQLWLEPGQEHVLGWELTWSDDVASALSGRRATIDVPVLAAPVGTPINVRTPGAGDATITATEHGVTHHDHVHSDGRRSRIAVLHYAPLEELVRARVATVLHDHRPIERPGSRGAAFVPYDNDTGLRVTNDLGWGDWSDGAERMGMAHLLLTARERGWCEQGEVDDALHAYRDFCREHLMDSTYRIVDSSMEREREDEAPRERLYNVPWGAQLFAELFAAYADEDDLDAAVAILDRYYSGAGGEFLAHGIAEAVLRTADLCRRSGRDADANRLAAHLVRHAETMAALGSELPAHEVDYEQSIVAPLLSIIAGAWRIQPSDQFAEALQRGLPWLLAFAGRQPHVRLRHIPVRHWDGYWFGVLRRWGDVFPHYWSLLTARVLRDWPREVPMPQLTRNDSEAIIRDICLANLADFTPRGRASCAFVFPSAVDGVPAHSADPMANDQDWVFTLILRLGTSGRAPLPG